MQILKMNIQSSQPNFGMNIKPTPKLAELKSSWPKEVANNFDKMCGLLKKYDPDMDTYIKMTESNRYSAPQSCLIELIIPFKDSKTREVKQVSYSFCVNKIATKPKDVIQTVVANDNFPYWIESKAMILAEKYHEIVK